MRESDCFDTELSLAAHQAITDRLRAENLLTPEEAVLIRKRLSRMRRQLISPVAAEKNHTRHREAA